MALIRTDVTIQVTNNRKKTKGRNFTPVKKRDGKTVKLQNVACYTRVD